MDFAVRRRIPQILASCRTQRALDGLLLGVGDERFEVRFACARALLAITDDNPAVSLRREAAIAAVQQEVDRAVPPEGELDDPLEDDDQPWSLSDALQADRANRRLEHIFSILALLLQREPLRLAFRALHDDNGRHRGTALEYLQTVMPEELRDSLWPLLSESGPLPAPREAAQVLSELALSAQPQRPGT
jgi:hypothetical protein